MAFKPIEILINAKDNASSVFSSLQAKVIAVGGAIATYFGVSAFVGMVKGAADFEQGMSRVQAATGASAAEMAKLRKAAEDAGATTQFTSTEAAGALENLAKAGLNANDAIAALPAVLNLAAAGGIDLGQSSEYITKAVMGLGLAFTDAGRVADVLALGANATNTSVTGLAQALSYAAPVANTLGLSLESTVAIIGKFADAGIDASRAGTALNSIMGQFADPASKFRNELAAAGITTGNFEDALHQLAKAGPAGSKAINAVGLEAGPALRALLNQGMGALDELTGKLKNAEGSAAATAKVMQDNLNGSLTGLASAWDTVKNALATPVLPVLKDGVDQLASAFRDAVKDGTVTKFGESIATAFKSGIQFVKDFIGTVDFAAVLQRLQDFSNSANETFTKVGEYATNAGNTIKLAYGVMSAGVSGVLTVIYGIGSVFASVASSIMSGVAMLRDGLAKITFGGLSESFKLAAEDARNAAQGFGDAAQAMRDKASAALDDTASAAQTARDGFTGLAGAIDTGSAATQAWAKTVAAANAELARTADTAAAAATATQKKAQADQAARQSADDHRAAVTLLRTEYQDLVAKGDLQAATLKLLELNKALAATGPVAKDAAKAAADAAAQIDAAFGRLGVTSSASLTTQAANAKRDYETIKNAGTSTAEDIGSAFKKAAEDAIAANKGVAPSWVEAEAAARGYRVEVDGAGKATIVSMSSAKDAVAAVGKAVIDVSAALKQMGIDAATASQQVKDLAAAGQMLAAAEQARRDAYNKDLDASKFMNRPDMNPIDQVPTFNTRAEADAWFAEKQKQYQRKNPFTTNSGGALGNLGMDTLRAEFQAELDALAVREAMKKANGGTTPTSTTTGPTPGTTTGTTVNITVQGVTRSINTDPAGASALQELIRQLTSAKSTS